MAAIAEAGISPRRRPCSEEGALRARAAMIAAGTRLNQTVNQIKLRRSRGFQDAASRKIPSHAYSPWDEFREPWEFRGQSSPNVQRSRLRRQKKRGVEPTDRETLSASTVRATVSSAVQGPAVKVRVAKKQARCPTQEDCPGAREPAMSALAWTEPLRASSWERAWRLAARPSRLARLPCLCESSRPGRKS